MKTCDELVIDLQIHKRKVHPEKPVDRQNVCSECQKDFTWKGLLLHHVCFKSENDLQEKEESRFKCPDCDLVQTQRFFMIHYKVIYKRVLSMVRVPLDNGPWITVSVSICLYFNSKA